MFHSIYIIKKNGVCVFAKHYMKSNLDDQLVSGLLTALGDFSAEALGSEPQAIQLKTNQQLSLVSYPEAHLVGVALADSRDHPALLSRLLKVILVKFSEEYHEEIKCDDPRLFQTSEKFSRNVDRILQFKVTSRTTWKLIGGNLIALSLVILLMSFLFSQLTPLTFILQLDSAGLPTIIFVDGINPSEFLILQLISSRITGVMMVVCVLGFFLPSLLSGYLAGNTKRGVISGIILSVFTGIITFIGGSFAQVVHGQFNLFWWFLTYFPLIISLSIICGYMGGYLKSRKRLWPLEGQKFFWLEVMRKKKD